MSCWRRSVGAPHPGSGARRRADARRHSTARHDPRRHRPRGRPVGRCSTSSTARVESFRVRRSRSTAPSSPACSIGIDIHQASPHPAFTHRPARKRRRGHPPRAAARGARRGGEPPQNSSLAATYLKLDSADLDRRRWPRPLTGALVSPVITHTPPKRAPHRPSTPNTASPNDAAAPATDTPRPRTAATSNANCAATS